MKYTLTWKSILFSYISSFFAAAGVILLYLISARSFTFTESIGVFFLVYISYFVFIFILSWKHFKSNVLGNHEIKIEHGYFIWTNGKQKIETDMKLLEKIKITKKYFTLKFKGMRVVKLYKSDAEEGYQEFINQISEEGKRGAVKVIQKT